MEVNINTELLREIKRLLHKQLREVDINSSIFEKLKDAISKIDISIKPANYCNGGTRIATTEDIVTCNKVTLHNAIDQLKEVAKSNGLKAVITFEAI